MPEQQESSSPATCATAVEFDFATKTHRFLTPAELPAALAAGKKVWIDVDLNLDAEAPALLSSLGVIPAETLEQAATGDALTRMARLENCIHIVVSGCRPRGLAFELERVDALVGATWFVTLHRGPILFLSSMRRDYLSDFRQHAQSMSFLLYELWDHLLENYLTVQKLMEERVEQLQTKLQKESVADSVFALISELGADILHFRKVLLPTRSVLKDLSSRKTVYVSEATQPFLGNMVGTVENVLQDLIVDREVLSESLNLHMSIVSHRTNLVMKRLTIVSVIFLPLTFLVGVYGMNFDVMPELRWRFGYGYFWSVTVLIVVGLLALMRKNRLF